MVRVENCAFGSRVFPIQTVYMLEISAKTVACESIGFAIPKNLSKLCEKALFRWKWWCRAKSLGLAFGTGESNLLTFCGEARVKTVCLCVVILERC